MTRKKAVILETTKLEKSNKVKVLENVFEIKGNLAVLNETKTERKSNTYSKAREIWKVSTHGQWQRGG